MNKLEWYNVIILSAQVSGIANSIVSFLGVVTSLNNKEFSKIYFSASISTFHIAVLMLGNFWVLDINPLSMGWLNNLPVFLSQLQVNELLLEPFLYYF